MILESIRIENYRSIKDVTLHCDSLTALVGANGSGKSSILRAVGLFFEEKPALTEEDYYDRQTGNAIRITATFKNMSDSAKAQFKDYIPNGKLAVARVFEWGSSKRSPPYHGIRAQNPDFVPIYNTKRGAKQLYDELLEKDAYADFPKKVSYEEMTAHLRGWEADNPGMLKETQDDGKYFTRDIGFPEKFVRFLYVEPVRNATEDVQERNSTLTQLLDIVVRSTLMANDDIREFIDNARSMYKTIISTSGQEELNGLGGSITESIGQFVSGAEANLSWNQTELDIGLPAVRLNLREDGFQSTVDRAGHGLQRVFIMSMLQHLSEAQAGSANEDSGLPTLVLAIDEPELYQHPNRQRHMSKVLRSLASGGISGASSETQIVYSTHSPHFVGIDRLDQIRRVRKTVARSGSPNVTDIRSASTAEVKNRLASISRYSAKNVKNLELILQTIMTPTINEGFFADLVVLVEGEKDRAALTAVAELMGYGLEKLGVSIVPCGGKDNLFKIAPVFQEIGIPLYCMWDTDHNNEGANLNPILLAIMGQPSEDQSSVAYDTHACLNSKLEDAIEKCFGDKYDKYAQECMEKLHLTGGVNKPYAIYYMIKNSKKDRVSFQVFEDIIRNVVSLCPRSTFPHGG